MDAFSPADPAIRVAAPKRPTASKNLRRKQDALEKPEVRCPVMTTEVAAPSADTAWQKVLKDDPGASAQTFEDWYRMWNFRDEDIGALQVRRG